MKIKNITVISLEGRIAQLTGVQLDDYLKAQVDRGNKNLILDFTKVDFTNTIGLRILLGSIKHARINGGNVLLANVSPLVHNILITTGFVDLLHIYTDVDSALINF